MLRSLITAVLVMFMMVSHAGAERPHEIAWGDLVPSGAPIISPFEALSVEIREDLIVVLRARDDLRFGFLDEDSDEYQSSIKLARKLEDQGVDIDDLLKQVIAMEEEIERRGSTVVPTLDGKVVRMPGYALPLEFSDTGVQEFLLVPYVGACIHTPPPPPNQIVFVKLDKPYEVENLYEPVWITGQMRIEQSSRSLNFVDGTAPIATGYALHGISVEPYQ